MRKNLYIPSIDAKDLYLSNNFIQPIPYGYKLTHKDGTDNFRKYVNSFDYSLDLIELRNVARKIYKSKDSLSFTFKDKEYSSKVINVTFKYAVKEFNKVAKNIYVRNGYNLNDYDMTDGYAVIENDSEKILVAIDIGRQYYNPVPSELLPSYFSYTYDEK